MRLFLARLGQKHNSSNIFEKTFEKFHKNIAKNALFLHIFPKEFNNRCVTFFAFGRKTQIVWKLREHFETF